MYKKIRKINKQTTIMVFVCGTIFIICCILSQFQISSYIALITFVGYFIYLIGKNPAMYAKYLAYIFMMCAAVIGTVVIEFNDIYLKELEISSHFAGSLPLLLTSYWLLFVVFSLFESHKKVSIINIEKNSLDSKFINFVNIATGVTIIIFLIMFLSVVHNAAFLLGIDRFVYASLFETNRIISILTNLAGNFLLFPMLSILYGKKYLGWISLSLYFLYFLWTGNKFGPFFTAMCILCLVYYSKLKEKGKTYSRRILAGIGILFAFLIATTVMLSYMTNSASTNYLLERTAMQGQEWWKTYDLCKGTVHPTDFSAEIEAILNANKDVTENIDSQHGIYRIMYLTAPVSRINSKLSTGSVYTEAGFASAYYYFGAFGNILFSIIMGVVIALTLNGFIRAFNNQDVIKMLIFLRFFQLERTNLSMFLFNDMFDVASIISYIILIWSYGKSIYINLGNGRFRIRLNKYTVNS